MKKTVSEQLEETVAYWQTCNLGELSTAVMIGSLLQILVTMNEEQKHDKDSK